MTAEITSPMTGELPEDLRRFLNQATMFHPSRIWAKASYTYDTKISYRKGIVLGGAYSPYFLQERETQPRMGWNDVGGTTLGKCRLMYVDFVPESANLLEWIGFLQTIAKEREGLLIVVDSFANEEILSTLLINNLKNMLQVVVVKQPDVPGVQRAPATKFAVLDRLQLPAAGSAWIRKDSSIAFVEKSDSAASLSPPVECAVIEVGGHDADDIRKRVLLMNNAITAMNAATQAS